MLLLRLTGGTTGRRGGGLGRANTSAVIVMLVGQRASVEGDGLLSSSRTRAGISVQRSKVLVLRPAQLHTVRAHLAAKVLLTVRLALKLKVVAVLQGAGAVLERREGEDNIRII